MGGRGFDYLFGTLFIKQSMHACLITLNLAQISKHIKANFQTKFCINLKKYRMLLMIIHIKLLKVLSCIVGLTPTG